MFRNYAWYWGIAAALAAPLAAVAEPVYTVTWLPENVGAISMNNAGHVAISAIDRVAIWSDTGERRIPWPYGYIETYGINNHDDVILDSTYNAYVYINDGFADIGAAAPDYTHHWARGINDAGWVVGSVNGKPDTSQTWAFIYRDGHFEVLPRLPGGSGALAMAVNNRGQVTGRSGIRAADGGETEHAFIYENGRLTDIGAAGGTRSVGWDINDRGEVAGTAWRADQPGGRGFLYSKGRMFDIGALDGGESGAFAVNNGSVVVGYNRRPAESIDRGVIYVRGHLVDLNRLVAAPAGWVVVAGLDINDGYQILANLCRRVGPAIPCRTARLDPPYGTRNYKIPPFIQRLGEGWLPTP